MFRRSAPARPASSRGWRTEHPLFPIFARISLYPRTVVPLKRARREKNARFLANSGSSIRLILPAGRFAANNGLGVRLVRTSVRFAGSAMRATTKHRRFCRTAFIPPYLARRPSCRRPPLAFYRGGRTSKWSIAIRAAACPAAPAGTSAAGHSFRPTPARPQTCSYRSTCFLFCRTASTCSHVGMPSQSPSTCTTIEPIRLPRRTDSA